MDRYDRRRSSRIAAMSTDDQVTVVRVGVRYPDHCRSHESLQDKFNLAHLSIIVYLLIRPVRDDTAEYPLRRCLLADLKIISIHRSA
jgi:hypothetical protein